MIDLLPDLRPPKIKESFFKKLQGSNTVIDNDSNLRYNEELNSED